MSIRWKLGIIFLVISFIPLIISSVIGIYWSKETLKREIGRNFELIAREKATEVAGILNRRMIEAERLATDPKIIAAVVDANSSYTGKDDSFSLKEIKRIDRIWLQSKGDTPLAQEVLNRDISATLRDYQARDPREYGEIFITDRLGATIAMTSTLTDFYQADEGWWREGYADGKGAVYIDDRGLDISVNAVVTGVIVPVRVGSEVIGLLKLNFKMAHLPAIVDNPYEEEADVRVFMHRSNGTAVIDASNGLHETVTETEARVIADAVTSGWDIDTHDLDPTIMGYARIQPKKTIHSRFQASESLKGVSGESWGKTGWYVFVERSQARAYEPLYEMITVISIAGVIMAVILIFVAGLAANTVTRPLLKLRQGMKTISTGNLNTKIGTDRTDEIGDVMRDIDRMVEKLQETMASREDLNQEISERKQIEKSLHQAKLDAEKANTAKSEFLASMSHELRTPLNAVLGFAQMLQFDPQTELSPAQNGHVESIIKGGDHLLELVNEVLDLARIESNQAPISLEDVSANELVANSVALTKPLAEARDITILDDFSEGVPALLRTDVLRFKQILLNLLNNAVKYNKDGGTITISGHNTSNDFLHLSITDTGIGIPKEAYNSVFERFHRIGEDPTIAREGSGIGLTVARHLAERMGGRIGFESEVGVGSTFWVELPLTSNRDVLIWSDTYRVGVDAIDDDHQMLVSLSNRASQGSLGDTDFDEIINELVNYTHNHFKREEIIMDVCGCPDLEEHRRTHVHIAGKVDELAESWHKNRNLDTSHQLVQFLQTWLAGHVRQVDTEIANYTKGKEQEIRQALEDLK